MALEPTSPTNILEELHKIYLMALGKGNFSVALKINELLGREQGLFTGKSLANKQSKVSLDALSDKDIAHLIEELEAKLKLDQGEREG